MAIGHIFRAPRVSWNVANGRVPPCRFCPGCRSSLRRPPRSVRPWLSPVAIADHGAAAGQEDHCGQRCRQRSPRQRQTEAGGSHGHDPRYGGSPAESSSRASDHTRRSGGRGHRGRTEGGMATLLTAPHGTSCGRDAQPRWWRLAPSGALPRRLKGTRLPAGLHQGDVAGSPPLSQPCLAHRDETETPDQRWQGMCHRQRGARLLVAKISTARSVQAPTEQRVELVEVGSPSRCRNI